MEEIVFLGTVRDGKKGGHFLSMFYMLQLALNMDGQSVLGRQRS